MRSIWKPEICRMPDGGGGGGDGGGGFGTDMSYDGPGTAQGTGLDEAGQGGLQGTGGQSSVSYGAAPSTGGDDFTGMADGYSQGAAEAADLAYGYDALQGLPSHMAGNAYAGMDGMAGGVGLQGRDPGFGWGALGLGALASLFGGPVAGALASAIGSYAIDGRGPGEAIGQAAGGLVGGLAGPGLTGMATSMAASKAGGALGNALDVGDFTGDPGEGPSSEGVSGGGPDFMNNPAMPGQTYLPYLNPPTPQAPPQPAWRGLLGQTAAPQPNTWQGNNLFVPARGLLG